MTIPPLFRHAKRGEWGLAAVVWDDGAKRAYQFQDGRVRVLKVEFCRLMRPELHPEPHAADTVARLVHAAQVAAVAPTRHLRVLNEQVDRFLAEYPEGFADARWSEHWRGSPGPPLKRHRDPVLALAAARLGREELTALADAHDWAGVHDRIVEVFRTTDLVIARHVEAFADTRPNSDVALAIVDLIHGKDPDQDKLSHLRTELERWSGPAGSWSFTTGLRAVVHPREHVCVRPTPFAAQASLVLPGLPHTKMPTHESYAGYRQVAQLVRDDLTRRGYPPRDLLDVHDFIRTTVRPPSRRD